jgi:purine-binding chemotaxis protein CheW
MDSSRAPPEDTLPASLRETVLLVRAGASRCGLPLSSVSETMRPLPVAPLAGAPAFVRGVSIVRGEPVPVVDLAALLGGAPEAAVERFVSVQAGGRRAVLAVAAVLGVARLDPAEARTLPLVRDACGGALESLRSLDGDLLVVLGAARLVPEEAAAAAPGGEGRP